MALLAACTTVTEKPEATSTAARSPAVSTATRGIPPAPTSTPPVEARVFGCQWARLRSVVDGDTLQVALESGGNDTVRLIGIDAPERNQRFYAEATAEAERLLAGGRICLEKDVSDRDAFGRLLRYAWLEDGRMANELLVAAGVAAAVIFPPDVKYYESRLAPAERQAKETVRGIWAGATGHCDPSYPDICIPPPPPDLDCGDITFRRFRVLPPDPHRFDGDFNGLGCER